LQLIEEILSFAGLQGGRASVELEPVDLTVLLDEVRAVSEPLAHRKGIAFEISNRDGNGRIVTDPRKVRQILLNLVGNAVKFTDRGSVTVAVERSGDALLFHVTDTGIGIRADQLTKVFEPFWQGDQSRTRLWGGTGLGLAISQRMAGLLGGELSVESHPDRGSRFSLRLPLEAPAVIAVAEAG
jgi:signal transduction histidine kinase